MLITVTTGNQVLMYEADSNPSIEEWKIVVNLTKLLQQHYKFDLNTLTNYDINRIETICVDWSPYNNDDDISLIALGSKAGVITIWKFDKNIKFFTSVNVFDTYVYSLKWSNWYFTNEGDAYIYLIAGSCEGELKGIKFTINFKTKKCQVKIKTIEHSNESIISILELSEDYNNDGKCKMAVVNGNLIKIYDLNLQGNNIIEKDKIKIFDIPYIMTIGSVQFYDYDETLRIYTMDGKAIDISTVDNELVIKEDYTLSFLKAIFYHPVDNQEESEINKTQSFLDFVEENSAVPRYFGAQKSINELCDTVLYITYAPKAMNYRTSGNSYCYLLIYSNYLLKANSEKFENNVIKNIDHWLKDELIFQKYTSSCLFWDVVQYTEKLKNNNEEASEKFCLKVIDHLMAYNIHQEDIYDIEELNIIKDEAKDQNLCILKLAKKIYKNKKINSLKLINSFIQSIKFLLSENYSKKVEAIKQRNVEIIRNYISRNFVMLFNIMDLSKYYEDERSIISILLICDSILLKYKINKDLLPILKKIYRRLKKSCNKIKIDVDNELSIIDDIESGKIEKKEKERKEKIIEREKEKEKEKINMEIDKLEINSTNENNETNNELKIIKKEGENNNNNNNNNNDNNDINNKSEDDDIIKLISREKCPACLTSISFRSMSFGVCENGHSWDRCSNSLLITNTPYIKSCQSCFCKALVDTHPRSNISVPLIVKDLQNHFKSCIYCGNQFIYLL